MTQPRIVLASGNRGKLDELQAIRILTHAFAAGIVARVSNASLAELLSSKVEQRLGDLAASG